MSSIDQDLLRNYARLGWEHWNDKSKKFQDETQERVGVEIVDSVWNAQNAAANPFKLAGSNGNRAKLIPMPCEISNITAAFFLPWTATEDSSDLSFDLVVLLEKSSPCTFAFRFEPASRDNGTTHGYDHMQLSNSLCLRRVSLKGVLDHLPSSYPALPIPSKDPVTRFLVMIVSMHGYPRGVINVLSRAFNGNSSKSREYHNLTRNILNVQVA